MEFPDSLGDVERTSWARISKSRYLKNSGRMILPRAPMGFNLMADRVSPPKVIERVYTPVSFD
jgi:hypothetical protein